MKRNLLGIGLTVAVALVGGAAGVSAQGTETDQLQALRARIRADRQALVADNLGLTDAEGKSFWPLYWRYRGEMAGLGDRLQKLIQDGVRIWADATADQARAMVDEFMAIHEEEVKVKESYLPRFRKVLPEQKVARFLQIENKIDAIVRFELSTSVPLIVSPK